MLLRHHSEVAPVTYGDEAKGVEMRPLITEQEGAPTFALRLFTLAPGGHTPLHQHPWEHEVYVLAGSGSVHGAEGERPLRVGDAVFIGPGELHQFRSQAGMQFICCIPHPPR
ncbi:MAG: cupin domain-containing protein [Deltaproteobacteria bacterium]|nr:cupin domain-containing protein [Deltaproteobacteria bacterium]